MEEGKAGGGEGEGGTCAPVGSLSRLSARASIMLAKSLALLGPAPPLAGARRSWMNDSRGGERRRGVAFPAKAEREPRPASQPASTQGPCAVKSERAGEPERGHW